jgi:hypothetical protein
MKARYFLSALAEEVLGAGVLAAGAEAGAEAEAEAEESPLVEPAAGAVADSPPAGAGFAEPYPSAYQPPPLSEKAGAESTRTNTPPQCGHVVISGSENFWIFSVLRWQAEHSYS